MVSRKNAGVILKNLRITANKTRADIADILCVTEGAVAKYEEGKNNVPPDSICQYAEALNVEVMDLLRLTGHMPANLPIPLWRENGKWRIGKERKEEEKMDEKMVDMEKKAMRDGLSNSDIVRMAQDVIKNTNMEKEEVFAADRIRVEISVLTAVIMYLLHYTTYCNHTFKNIKRLLTAGIEEDFMDNDSINTPMHYLFDEVKSYEEEASAVKCYETYMAAPRCLRRTAISCLIERLVAPCFPTEFWDRYFEDFDEERAVAEEKAAKVATEATKIADENAESNN